jgi:hypothetical protein
MQARFHLLFPFDLGLELDFTGKDAREFFKEISARKMGVLSFEDATLSQAEITTQVYRFGVGVIQISFMTEGEIDYLARLSSQVEKIRVGKAGIVPYCSSLVEGLVQRAVIYATYKYDKRFADVEIFPICLLTETPAEDVQSFIDRNYNALFGLVAGETRYNSLSRFVLEKERLINYGYYENEIILIKRFGALVYSAEATTIVQMIKLAFAQYWSMRTYNFLLDGEMDTSRKLLEQLPPYYKFWKLLSSYQLFSTEALDFDRDKIAIIDSLYNVTNIPQVESDWHLRTLYQSVNRVFNIEDLHRSAETKIERMEASYNSARDFLSNNFFILLDVIFFLSLAWSIIDTFLLLKISQGAP